MVNSLLITFVIIVLYYGLIDMISLKVSDLISYTHKKAKRRPIYKYVYIILFLIIIPYLIIDKIIKGGE